MAARTGSSCPMISGPSLTERQRNPIGGMAVSRVESSSQTLSWLRSRRWTAMPKRPARLRLLTAPSRQLWWPAEQIWTVYLLTVRVPQSVSIPYTGARYGALGTAISGLMGKAILGPNGSMRLPARCVPRSCVLMSLMVQTGKHSPGDDPGRAAIMPLLTRQSRFMNNPDAGDLAFGAIDGSGRSTACLEIVPAKGAREIVLSSDGYCAIDGTLAEAEATLADMLQRDPGLFLDCAQTKGIRPGNISFDDRAFLRATV